MINVDVPDIIFFRSLYAVAFCIQDGYKARRRGNIIVIY